MADSKDLKSVLQEDLVKLAAARDELRVQIELAKAEAKEEWNRLETTWLQIQDEVKRTAEHSKEPIHNVGAAVRQLLDELKTGYERVRAQLKTSH